MRLNTVQIREFRSIQDSKEVEIGDVTCLVGKNESGKTAVLRALYRLNPIVEEDGRFDVNHDYPRSAVVNYKRDVAANRLEPAEVVHASYLLEPEDISAVVAIFGIACLKDENPALTLYKGYANEVEFGDLNVDEEESLKHLVASAGLPQPMTVQLLGYETAEEMVEILAEAEQTESVQQIRPYFDRFQR